MSDKLDLKALWLQQTPPKPEPTIVIEKAQRLKRKHWYESIFINSMGISVFLFVGAIWYYYQPQLMSTKIGLILTFVAIFLFMLVQNSMLPLLMEKESDLSNQDYLTLLLKLKKKQRFLQTTALSAYFLLLSLGLALYFWEYVVRMSLAMGLFCYGGFFVWVLINWFYFRPKIIQKKEEEVNGLIEQFKLLTNQLKE